MDKNRYFTSKLWIGNPLGAFKICKGKIYRKYTSYKICFINKGNTSYANAILQTLGVFPLLWNRVLSESPSLSTLLKSITLNRKIKSRSNKPVDPSNFLWALARKISESRHVPFNFNSQQDVAEVLQFVIDELKGTSGHFSGSQWLNFKYHQN